MRLRDVVRLQPGQPDTLHRLGSPEQGYGKKPTPGHRTVKLEKPKTASRCSETAQVQEAKLNGG